MVNTSQGLVTSSARPVTGWNIPLFSNSSNISGGWNSENGWMSGRRKANVSFLLLGVIRINCFPRPPVVFMFTVNMAVVTSNGWMSKYMVWLMGSAPSPQISHCASHHPSSSVSSPQCFSLILLPLLLLVLPSFSPAAQLGPLCVRLLITPSNEMRSFQPAGGWHCSCCTNPLKAWPELMVFLWESHDLFFFLPLLHSHFLVRSSFTNLMTFRLG